jgi:hypothetical protein
MHPFLSRQLAIHAPVLSRQLAIARRDDLMRDAARAPDAPRTAEPGSSVAQLETESAGRRRPADCTEGRPTSTSAAAPLRIMTDTAEHWPRFPRPCRSSPVLPRTTRTSASSSP